jgi:DNA polymerase elongation subunit (family B)
MATYNGDSFDFPFVEARAKIHGIDMYTETGFKRDKEDEFKSRSCAHMDCFRYVGVRYLCVEIAEEIFLTDGSSEIRTSPKVVKV